MDTNFLSLLNGLPNPRLPRSEFDVEKSGNNPYYTAVNAKWAWAIAEAWEKDNYKPVQLNASWTKRQPHTLRQKITNGLKFLHDHTEDPMAKAHVADILNRMKLTTNQHGLLLQLRDAYQPPPPMPTRSVMTPEILLKQDFMMWIKSEPAFGDEWPPHTTALHKLSPEEVDWYKQQLAILDAKNYGVLAFISTDNIKFVRTLSV